MALEKEAVGLIASSCVLIFLLTVGCVVFAYICYRRLERNKLSRLPKYGPRDVSAWATDVSSTMVTDIDAEIDYHNRLHAYRPKMLVYPKDSDRRQRQLRPGRLQSRQDTVTQVVENGRVVSVINVTNKPQDAQDPDLDSIANGHTVVRPDGLYVYGHPSRLEDEGEIHREHVMHESEGRVVHGYMIQEDLHDQNVHQVTMEGRSVLHKQPPQAHGSDDLPELVKGHIVEQTVEVGEAGHLVVTSSRQLDLNESTGFGVAHHEGPLMVYGHHSTHKDFGPSDTGHPARFAKPEQFPTSTHLALEGIAATGVSVSVPHIIASHLEYPQTSVPQIIVSELEDPQTSGMGNNGSSDDEDDEEYDRKRRENYKVIKKHSAYKVPDWVIRKVTEQEPNMDPEIKDTVVHLEQRIGTGHEPHRESISEIERRLSNFSASAKTHSVPVSPEAPPRRTAVTFGEVTHIQDADILSGDDSDDGDPRRRFSDLGGPVVEDYLEAGTSTMQTYSFPDGTIASVVTVTTATTDVSHVLDINHTRASPLTSDQDVGSGGSTLGQISQQLHLFSESL